MHITPKVHTSPSRSLDHLVLAALRELGDPIGEIAAATRLRPDTIRQALNGQDCSSKTQKRLKTHAQMSARITLKRAGLVNEPLGISAGVALATYLQSAGADGPSRRDRKAAA